MGNLSSKSKKTRETLDSWLIKTLYHAVDRLEMDNRSYARVFTPEDFEPKGKNLRLILDILKTRGGEVLFDVTLNQNNFFHLLADPARTKGDFMYQLRDDEIGGLIDDILDESLKILVRMGREKAKLFLCARNDVGDTPISVAITSGLRKKTILALTKTGLALDIPGRSGDRNPLPKLMSLVKGDPLRNDFYYDLICSMLEAASNPTFATESPLPLTDSRDGGASATLTAGPTDTDYAVGGAGTGAGGTAARMASTTQADREVDGAADGMVSTIEPYSHPGDFRAIPLGDLNTKFGSNGYSLLHLAVRMNKISLIKALARRGVDMNPTNTTGNTPLNTAASLGRKDAFLALVDAGASLDGDATTSPAARIKVICSAIACEESSLTKKTEDELRRIQSGELVNPLYQVRDPRAVDNETMVVKTMVEIAIDSGVELYNVGRDGENALQFAVRALNFTAIDVLMDKYPQLLLTNERGISALDSIKSAMQILEEKDTISRAERIALEEKFPNLVTRIKERLLMTDLALPSAPHLGLEAEPSFALTTSAAPPALPPALPKEDEERAEEEVAPSLQPSVSECAAVVHDPRTR